MPSRRAPPQPSCPRRGAPACSCSPPVPPVHCRQPGSIVKEVAALLGAHVGGGSDRSLHHRSDEFIDPREQSGVVQRCAADLRRAGEGDRKSTRLNSSHVANSYAVFCLKKRITSYA